MKIHSMIIQIIKLTCRSNEAVNLSSYMLFVVLLRAILVPLEECIAEELDFLRNGKIRTIKSQ